MQSRKKFISFFLLVCTLALLLEGGPTVRLMAAPTEEVTETAEGEWESVGDYTITTYSADPEENGGHVDASGTALDAHGNPLVDGLTVAVSPLNQDGIEQYMWVYIAGIGVRQVLDVGPSSSYTFPETGGGYDRWLDVYYDQPPMICEWREVLVWRGEGAPPNAPTDLLNSFCWDEEMKDSAWITLAMTQWENTLALLNSGDRNDGEYRNDYVLTKQIVDDNTDAVFYPMGDGYQITGYSTSEATGSEKLQRTVLVSEDLLSVFPVGSYLVFSDPTMIGFGAPDGVFHEDTVYVVEGSFSDAENSIRIFGGMVVDPISTFNIEVSAVTPGMEAWDAVRALDQQAAN